MSHLLHKCMSYDYYHHTPKELVVHVNMRLPQNHCMIKSTANLIYPRQEYSLKWINKTAGFVKCFFSGIFADSNARHFNFCPKTKKIYN